MAFDFSGAFHVVSRMFGSSGTYYDAGGTATVLSGSHAAILSEPRGALTVEGGVLMPDCDADVTFLKAAVPTRPTRKARYYDGTDTWDSSGDVSEDASRLAWVLPCKRRSS